MKNITNNTFFQIEELVLDYTRMCNSRCTYCGIWEIKNGPELGLEAIENVFKAPQLRNLKSCYVTGGEPYITDKIVDVAALLHEYIPDCLLTGATNGIQCEKILERMLKIRDMGCKIHIQVSLNGTRSTHDATRGQRGYWDKAVTLVDRLIANGIGTTAAFSMMPQTAQDLPYMQKFCAARGIPMEFVWVRQSDRYGTVNQRYSAWPEPVKPNLRLIENLPDYFDCPALRKRLVVTPDGSVYPCEIYLANLLLGNVNQRALEEILNDPHAVDVAEMIANRGCTWCQGTGEADGSPKWMVMDCYRRQSPQALQLEKTQPQARYMQPKQSACVVSEVIGAPVDTGSQIVYKPATVEELAKKKKIRDKLSAIAIRDFEKLLQIYPNNAAFLRELGDLYYWQTNVIKAAPLFNKACSIEPSSDTAWEGLVNSLVATGEKKLVMKALDLWLRVKPGSTRALGRRERLKWQEQLIRSLHNRHKGQRAFILGTGLSLLDYDLSPLKDEITFGVNGLCEIPSFPFAPTYYCVSDMVGWERWDTAITRLPSLKIISVPPCKNVPEREDFLRLPFNWHQQIHQGYFAGTAESFYQTHLGWTVILDICLQVAYHMGFSEIYLLGVDVAARNGQLHAYDEKPQESATQWTIAQFSRMIQGFEFSREIYERAGRKIYNLSPASKLDVFEKRDFISVLAASANRKSKPIILSGEMSLGPKQENKTALAACEAPALTSTLATGLSNRTSMTYANSTADKAHEIKIHDKLFSSETTFDFELENPYQLSKIKMLFPYLDQLVALKKNVTVLDIGCGKGLSLSLLEKRYPDLQLIGFDLSPAGCKIAGQRTSAHVFQADAEDIPIESESIDVALHIATIHHFYRYPERVLQETNRVLKKGGYVLITDPNAITERHEVQQRVMQIRDHTVAILDLLTELLRPIKKFSVLPSAIPKNPGDSITEKPIPADVLESKLISCGFHIVERGFVNYASFEARRYPLGWEIAEAIDRYLIESAPKSAAQVYFIVQKK